MSGDRALLRSLLPALVDNVQQWTASHWAADPGCFWQYADRDGQEHSIGGDGCRPLLGSVMFGEAHALARIARELGEEPTAAHFTREADRFRAAVLRLWSPELGFFVTRATPRPASVPRARWAERQTQLARERSSSSSSSSSSRSSRSGRSGRRSGGFGGGVGGGGGGGGGGAAGRVCPPNWVENELVSVRELMGLSSPWYTRADCALIAL